MPTPISPTGITVPDLDEGDNVIVVTVTAEDGSTATYTVTVTQEAANSPPVFPAPDPRELSVAENVPLGTDVGAPVTATDPDDDPLTYSLTTSPHSGHFQIDSATGQLVTNIAARHVFNHERDPNVSAVQVVAEDGRGGTAQITVTVSVTDVDEPPDAPVAVTVTGSGTTSLGVSWTAPSNQWRPDIDDYDVQYREVGASSWTDGPQDVTGTNTTIMSVDAGKSYEVQVRATNDEGDGPWAISGGTTNTAATGAPEIDGTPQVGQTLTAGMGDIDDDDGPPTTTFPDGYSFQWVRVATGGAETNLGTSRTYSPTSTDEGSTIRVDVTFTDGAGFSETVPSDAVGPVVPAAGPCPANSDWCTTMTVGVVASLVTATGYDHQFYGALDDTTIDYGRKSLPVAFLQTETGAGTNYVAFAILVPLRICRAAPSSTSAGRSSRPTPTANDPITWVSMNGTSLPDLAGSTARRSR